MRLNIQRLSAEAVTAQYHQKLNEKIGETMGSSDVNCPWESIHETEETIAQKVIGTAQWGDLIVCSTKSTNENNAARNRMLVANTWLTEYCTECSK